MPASPPTRVISNRDLPSLAEWQAALDREDFLVRLRLDALDVEPERRSFGYLDNHQVGFHCERRSVPQVVGPDRVVAGERWSLAYAFWGGGLLDSACAANMLAVAFANATGGAFFRSDRSINRDLGDFKVTIDVSLSSALGRHDLFEARYPDFAREEPAGPGMVVSKLAN